ncbi:TolC family protein [Desulfosporosinus sp. SYSU MS00001]|uniref:TolC family protein n=1 Tax=Desulfosporosinus sp. SYSU MS00001 TaxID=3416284 RepID=UPI003CEBE3F6
MKKVIFVLFIGLMLLVSTSTALAADDSLDIEKVAIASIKNSQNIQSVERRVALAEKYNEDVTTEVNLLRSLMSVRPSYQSMVAIITLPVERQNDLDKANNAQSVVTNGTRLTAYKAYIDLLKAKYSLDIQQGLMNGLNGDYQKAQQQESLGLISPAELRLSQINYLKSQYAYNSAQKTYQSASMNVQNLMGEDMETLKQYSTLQDNNITPTDHIRSLDGYVNLAIANRAEIIDAQNTLDKDKKEYELGKSEMPTDYKFYCQQQQYVIDSAQNDLDLAKINVQKNIVTLFGTLEAAMTNLDAEKDLEDQAVVSYQAAETEFKNGQITLKELGDAKVAKAQADMNYKNAQLDAWLAQTTMGSACGVGYVPAISSSGMTTVTHKNNPNPTNPNDRND